MDIEPGREWDQRSSISIEEGYGNLAREGGAHGEGGSVDSGNSEQGMNLRHGVTMEP